MKVYRDNSYKKYRSIVYQMFNGHCMYCGEELEGEWHIDHILPISRGGENNLGNLGPSCKTCNLLKSDFTVEEFKERINKRGGKCTDTILYFELVNGYRSIPLPEHLRYGIEV